MSNIRVAVRVRPLNNKEKDDGAKEVVKTRNNVVSIENIKVLGIPEFGDSRARIREFTFDHCYDNIHGDTAASSQNKVFQDLGTQVLQNAFDGFNACVFAYGQTGTGKTHTMMGYPGDVGLIPRICEGLFSHVSECEDDHVSCRIDISYFEIYNERVRDLLQPELLKLNENYSLKIREHPKDGPYVKDLSWHRVKNNKEIQSLLDRGNEYRVTAETYMHGHSSRSHAIVAISFTQARLEENRPSEIVSKINLVDLAGSERADPSSKPDFRKRLTEGSNINKSLVTLGYVIKALAERSLLSWSTDEMGSLQNFASSGGGEASACQSPAGPNKQRLPYIPYRDSVLTWLLKDSLGGNSKTIMIATITPASQYYSESLSTLRYAQRAKTILNKPTINEDCNVALIKELRKEIGRLHEMLASANTTMGGNLLSLQDENNDIAEKLHENEEMAKRLTQNWMGRWASTHDIMKESDLSIRGLRNRTSSMGVMIDSQLPYLVGLDGDVLSTGIVIFHLKEGETLVGKEDAVTQQDIVLEGPTIQTEHCKIENSNGEVYLHPCPGAMCVVQGSECTLPTKLSQGDYVVLGGNQVFRFNNPTEAAKLREHRKSQGSLNQLSTSHQSFGGLSRASSYSSIGDDLGYLSPYSQLGRSYPNHQRRHSDLVIRELERRYQTEQERMEEAQKELDHLRGEHEKAEELRQLKEEEMYEMHEQHRADIETQKQHLARLVEENERARAKAEEELQLARESLAKEKQAFQNQIQEERLKLKALQKLEQESMGIQTEPPSTQSTSVGCDNVTKHSTGTGTSVEMETSVGTGTSMTKGDNYGIGKGSDQGSDHEGANSEEEDDVCKVLTIEDIPVKYKDGRKMSVEDQIAELNVDEVSRRLLFRETEQSLAIQEEDMEEAYSHTQEQIEEKLAKIQQAEEAYRQLDQEHLHDIEQQSKKVEELHKQEVQLEVYIQENEELLSVQTHLPQPLRTATSEMFLLDIPADDDFTLKTTSMHDVQGEDEDGMLMRSSSEQTATSSEGRSDHRSRESSVESNLDDPANKNLKHDKDGRKISSVAKQVTSRLYKSSEPKFKYVPKTREKEIETISKTKIYRERGDPMLRELREKSPIKVLRDIERSKSESPQRLHSKRSSASPVKDTDIRKRASSAPNKPPVHDKPKKDPTTKDASSGDKKSIKKKVPDHHSKPGVKKGSDKTKGPTEKTDKKPDEGGGAVAVRNKGTKSPDRVVPHSSGRLGTARFMNSASSLASVPESDEPVSPRKPEPDTIYVVKKRAKKGRASFLDDGFRCHSAPDSQSMAEAYDEYAEQMEAEKYQEAPDYQISVSVDELELTGQNEALETDKEMKSDTPVIDHSVKDKAMIIDELDLQNTKANEQITDAQDLDLTEKVSERKRQSVSGENVDPDTVPNKKTKSEGDKLSKSYTEGIKPKMSDNGMFSDDSLEGDISMDSLDENSSKKLTQSLPPSFFTSDKQMSSDSLSSNDGEDNDSDGVKIMPEPKHSKTPTLSRSKVIQHNVDSELGDKNPTKNLITVSLEQINITEPIADGTADISNTNDELKQPVIIKRDVNILENNLITKSEPTQTDQLNKAQINKLSVNVQECIDINGVPVELEATTEEKLDTENDALQINEVKSYVSELVNSTKDKLTAEKDSGLPNESVDFHGECKESKPRVQENNVPEDRPVNIPDADEMKTHKELETAEVELEATTEEKTDTENDALQIDEVKSYVNELVNNTKDKLTAEKDSDLPNGSVDFNGECEESQPCVQENNVPEDRPVNIPETDKMKTYKELETSEPNDENVPLDNQTNSEQSLKETGSLNFQHEEQLHSQKEDMDDVSIKYDSQSKIENKEYDIKETNKDSQNVTNYSISDLEDGGDESFEVDKGSIDVPENVKSDVSDVIHGAEEIVDTEEESTPAMDLRQVGIEPKPVIKEGEIDMAEARMGDEASMNPKPDDGEAGCSAKEKTIPSPEASAQWIESDNSDSDGKNVLTDKHDNIVAINGLEGAAIGGPMETFTADFMNASLNIVAGNLAHDMATEFLRSDNVSLDGTDEITEETSEQANSVIKLTDNSDIGELDSENSGTTHEIEKVGIDNQGEEIMETDKNLTDEMTNTPEPDHEDDFEMKEDNEIKPEVEASAMSLETSNSHENKMENDNLKHISKDESKQTIHKDIDSETIGDNDKCIDTKVESSNDIIDEANIQNTILGINQQSDDIPAVKEREIVYKQVTIEESPENDTPAVEQKEIADKPNTIEQFPGIDTIAFEQTETDSELNTFEKSTMNDTPAAMETANKPDTIERPTENDTLVVEQKEISNESGTIEQSPENGAAGVEQKEIANEPDTTKQSVIKVDSITEQKKTDNEPDDIEQSPINHSPIVKPKEIIDKPKKNIDKSEETGDTAEASSSLVRTREVGVGTSSGLLYDTEASDDSYMDTQEELEILQEELEKLPKSGQGPQLSTARRAARQRVMIRHAHRDADSDGVCHLPLPGTQTGRPNSSSKRRKKQSSKSTDKLKLSTKYSSDDYDSSISEGIYSDDDSLENVLKDAGERDVIVRGNHLMNDPDEGTDVDMYYLPKRQRDNQQANLAKAKRDITEVVEESGGKRTVAIQAFGDGVSGGLVDPDASHNTSELVTSPVSVWQANEKDSSCGTISSGGVVKKNLTDHEKSAHRSSSPDGSFLCDHSNLQRGPTEMWSTSLTDLQPLPSFRDDLLYVMETEGMCPRESSVDPVDDNNESVASVYMRSPREGVRLIPRPDGNVPLNSGHSVSISFPESQLQETLDLSNDSPVQYQVTVHEDNTNIVYNVQKTEYRTYGDRTNTEPRVIPESICINMTETFVSRSEENSENKTSEEVKFNNGNGDGKNLMLERNYNGSYSSDREVRTINGEVLTDNLIECKATNESQSALHVPSENSNQIPQTLQVKTKVLKLESSGVVATTNYPAEEFMSPVSASSTNDDLCANLDDSDYTSDYGTITSIDGRKGFISFTDSEDNEGARTDTDFSPGTSPNFYQHSKNPDEHDPEILPKDQRGNTDIITSLSSQMITLVENSPNTPTGGSSEAIAKSMSESPDEETDASSASTVKQSKPKENSACLPSEPLEGSEPGTNAADNQNNTDYSVAKFDVCSPVKREDNIDSSVDDVYISMEQSENNTSSSSSDYRTPHQSPRSRFHVDVNGLGSQLEDVIIPDFCEDDILQSTPRQTADEMIIPDHRPALTSSPKRASEVRTVSVNTETVSSVNMTPLTASRVNHLVEGNKAQKQPEVYRQHLEKKIASLQHHVRSLSDSAISSDYTDGDSVSLSPRGSRVYEFDKKSGDWRPFDNSIKVYRIGQARQPYDLDKLIADRSPFNDSGNVFDGETDTDHDNHHPTSPTKRKIKLKRPCPIGSKPGKAPETLVEALMYIKPYPLKRSISLDWLSSVVSMKPELIRSNSDVQSNDNLKVRELSDTSESENHRTASVRDYDIQPRDVENMLNSHFIRKRGEKSNSLEMLEDKPSRDYLRSLSENDIEDFTEGHDTSNTSNDSITFVFIGDSSNGQRQRLESDDNNTAADVNSICTEEISNESYRSLSPGEIIERPDDFGDDIYIHITDDDPSSYEPSEEIKDILNRDYSEDLESSSDTLSGSFEDQIRRPRTETMEDSEPLRHRYGIDESVLPIPERSVSADNLPNQLRVQSNTIHRSRSTGMINVGVEDEEESESGIFPPRIDQCADRDSTEKSFSFRTAPGTDQSSARTGSGLDNSDVFDSDTTNSDGEDDDQNGPTKAKSCGSKASSTEDFREEVVIEYHSNKDRFKYTAAPNNATFEFDPQCHHEQEHLRQVLETVQKLIMPKPHTHERGMSTADDGISYVVSIGIQTDDDCGVHANKPINGPRSHPDFSVLPALAAPNRSQSVDSFDLGIHGNTLNLSERQSNWCTLGELMMETTELLRRINDRLPYWERQQRLSASEEHQANDIFKRWQNISIQTGGSLNNLTTVGQQTDADNVEYVTVIRPSQYRVATESTQLETEFRITPLIATKTTDSEVAPKRHENSSMQSDKDNKNDSLNKSVDINDSLNKSVTEEPVIPETRNRVTYAKMPETTTKMSALTTTESQSKLREAPNKTSASTTIEPIITSEHSNTRSVSQHSPVTLIPNNTSQVTADGTVQLAGTYLDRLPGIMAQLGLGQQFPDSANDGTTEDVNNSSNNKDNKDSQGTSGNAKTSDKGSKTADKASTLPGFTVPNMTEITELREEHSKLINNLKKASEQRKARKDALKARKKVPFNGESLSANSSFDPILGTSRADSNASDGSNSEVDNVLSDDNDEVKSDENDVVRSDDNEEQISEGEPVQSDENDEFRTSVSSTRSAPEVVQISIGVDPRTGLVVENKNYTVKPNGTQPSKSKDKKIPKPTHEHTWEMTKDELKSIWEKLPEARRKPEPKNMNDEVPDQAKAHIQRDPSISPENEVVDDVLGNDIISGNQHQNVITPPNQATTSIPKDLNKSIEEEPIQAQKHQREHSLLPSYLKGLDMPDAVSQAKPREGRVDKSPVYNRLEAKPNKIEVKPNQTEATSTKTEPKPNKTDAKLNTKPRYLTPQNEEFNPVTQELFRPSTDTCTSPIRKASRFTDYSTQMSLAYTDMETQTDTEPEAEVSSPTIVPEKKGEVEASKSDKSTKELEKDEKQMRENLEKLQKEKQHIMELLGLTGVPNSMTVELLEAKLNYCIGQTDMLLENLDNLAPDDIRKKKTEQEDKKTKDYITKYREDLHKSKADIEECRKQLNCPRSRGRGAGRGRNPLRRRDFFNHQRQAEVGAFKLERLREQQDYERSRHGTPTKGNTPLRGNTPLKGNTPLVGNSPVVTPRSDRSRSNSPSPCYITPREHKAHLIDLRRQLINEVVEEEKLHSRSCSPRLGHGTHLSLSKTRSPPRRSPSEQSQGFSPKASVTFPDSRRSYSSDATSGYATPLPPYPTPIPPTRRSPDTRPVSNNPVFGRPLQSSPNITYPTSTERGAMAKKGTTESTPFDEILRRSSFSSTSSPRHFLGYVRLYAKKYRSSDPSPRAPADLRLPGRFTSPESKPLDQALSLNLDCLQDDESGPYSPYSAYAREHLIPNERSASPGGVLRGTYKLYDSRNNQSDTSSMLSYDSDTLYDAGQEPQLDEEKLKHLRPIRADDIKAQIKRHK